MQKEVEAPNEVICICSAIVPNNTETIHTLISINQPPRSMRSPCHCDHELQWVVLCGRWAGKLNLNAAERPCPLQVHLYGIQFQYLSPAFLLFLVINKFLFFLPSWPASLTLMIMLLVGYAICSY